MKLKKKLIWSAMFTATLGLTACFNDSSSSSGSGSAISGIVADGYLGNATVCLDINENKLCDAGEPTATTASTGAYSINATSAQISSAPLLVLVTTNTTDSDLGGNTVNRPYTLAAPAGKGAFISPLTTLIQSELEKNPAFTLEVAEHKVKSDLGLADDDTVKLYENFIEKSSEAGISEADKDVYKALYQTAQIVARTLSKVEKAIEDLGHDIDEDDLQRLVAEEVSKQLSQLHAESKTRIGLGSDVETTFADSQAEALPDVTFTEQELEDKKTQYQEADSAVLKSLQSITQDGLALMQYADDSFLSFTNYGVYATTIVTEGSDIKIYRSNGKLSLFWLENFTTDAEVKADINNVAHQEFYNSSIMTFNAAGILSFTDNKETTNIQQFTEVLLSGITKPLSEVIDSYQGPSKQVTFAEGDVAYQFSYTNTPLVHAENIATQTFATVCPDTTVSCVVQEFPFSGWYSDLSNSMYLDSHWTGEKIAFVYDGTSVSFCKYEIDPVNASEPKRDTTNNIVCQANTKQALGSITKGTLADGTEYILTPVPDFDNGEFDEVRYQLYLPGDSDQLISVKGDFKNLKKDGSTSVGIATLHNLSAIKRIQAAATEQVD